MKKLVLLFLSIICGLCLAFSLTACENIEKGASRGLKYELSEDGESYIVTGIGSFHGDNLVIPSKYEGKPVTTIGQAAFSDCEKLTSVTIPNSVTTIGQAAFSDCKKIASVTIPNSVTTIGDDAFEGCYIKKATIHLSVITDIPKDALETIIITSGKEIPNSAFKDCKNLTSVTIPNSVTSIGSNAFYGCKRITSVTFEDTSDWYVNENIINVTNPSNNATYLAFVYYSYTWTKSK